MDDINILYNLVNVSFIRKYASINILLCIHQNFRV